MSRRGANAPPLNVDTLLPCLGLLSVNSTSERVSARFSDLDPILEGDAYYSEDYDVSAKSGKKTVDPLTGEEVVWNGGPGKTFNEAALIRIIVKDNEVWRKFYPPASTVAEGAYSLENFTSFHPRGTTKTIEPPLVPHWKSAQWPESKNKLPQHPTLAAARSDFLDKLEASLKPTEAGKAGAAAKMSELRGIVSAHGDTTDAKTLKEGHRTLLLALFAPVKGGEPEALGPRESLGPPPGWLEYYKPRGEEAKKAIMATIARVGKQKNQDYHDVAYVGPQYTTWDLKEGETAYKWFSAKTGRDAWLIYLNYQRAKIEPRDLAKKGDTEGKTITEGNKQQRAQESEVAKKRLKAMEDTFAKENQQRATESERAAEMVREAERLARGNGDGSSGEAGPSGTTPPEAQTLDLPDAMEEEETDEQRAERQKKKEKRAAALQELDDELGDILGLLGD